MEKSIIWKAFKIINYTVSVIMLIVAIVLLNILIKDIKVFDKILTKEINSAYTMVNQKPVFKAEIKDLVVNNKLERYLIVLENDQVFYIKKCDVRLMNEEETKICNKGRITL